MKKIFLLLIIVLSLSLFNGCIPDASPGLTPSEGEGEGEEEPTGDRVVLVELFNAEGCAASAVINPIMEDLAQQYGTNQVILLEEAGWGRYTTPEVQERFDWYVPGTKHTPFIAFNGLSDTFSEGVSSGGGGGGSTPAPTPPEPEPEPEPEKEVIYVQDTNPDSEILYIAGEEGGETIMSFGMKDSLGNILSMDGAVFLNDLGEGIAIEIDDNGYPIRLVDSDGNKLTFTNYTSSTVDISIYDFDENLIAGPITVDLDSDLLDDLLQLYNTSKGNRGLTRDGHDTAKFLKAAAVGLKLAGCAASAIGAAGTGGIAIPLAVIVCGSAVASLIEAIEPDILPITPVNSAATGVITNGLSLIFNDKFSPWGVGGWLLGNASTMIEFAATKEDIDEIHTQFIQALENQDWEGAWRCCILDSEAYNMVLGAEIAFANACLSPDNTTVDISFTDTPGWFVERPTAFVHHDDVAITITHDEYGTEIFSGDWIYSEFEEKYENKWRLTKSGILNLTGITPGPLPVPTLYDPGETISNDLEYTLSWSDESQHDGVARYFVIEDTSPQYNINSPDYKGYVIEETSLTLSHDVTEDTTYYYEVRSCAGCQGCAIKSDSSNQVSIKVLSDFNLPAPTLYDPGTSVNSPSYFTLEWSDESNTYGATTYYIHEDTTPTFDSPNFEWYSTDSTSRIFYKDVDSDTTYYYTVFYWSDTYERLSKHSNTVDIIIEKDNGGTYNLRDIGPAGGYIFYDKGYYSDGWRYLEAAPASTEWAYEVWGSYGTLIGGTGSGIGTGQSNTTKIVAWLNSHSLLTGYAAQLCDALVCGGYSDWFLPSEDELTQIHSNLHYFEVGGFSGYYWSSTEYDAYNAIGQRFSSHWELDYSYYADKKYDDDPVRAIRAF